tara:strand:- start:5518 stop:6219 length:702 start_codon:yes stop_codon:yes gene_type:complete
MKRLNKFGLVFGMLLFFAFSVNAEAPEGYYLYFEDDFSTDEHRDYWVADCELWDNEVDICGWDEETESFRLFEEIPYEYPLNTRLQIKSDLDYEDIYEFTVDFFSDSENCEFEIDRYFWTTEYENGFNESGRYEFRLTNGRGNLTSEVTLPDQTEIRESHIALPSPHGLTLHVGHVYQKECGVVDFKLDNLRIYKHDESVDGRLYILEYSVNRLANRVRDLWREVFGSYLDSI